MGCITSPHIIAHASDLAVTLLANPTRYGKANKTRVAVGVQHVPF